VAVRAVVTVAVGRFLRRGLGRVAVLRGLCVLDRWALVSLGFGCLRRSPLRQPRWWLHAVIHAVLPGKLLRRAYPATLPAHAEVPRRYLYDSLPVLIRTPCPSDPLQTWTNLRLRGRRAVV